MAARSRCCIWSVGDRWSDPGTHLCGLSAAPSDVSLAPVAGTSSSSTTTSPSSATTPAPTVGSVAASGSPSTAPGSSTTSSTLATPFVWPGDAPERFAAIYQERIELTTATGNQTLDISNVYAAAIIEDSFVFATRASQGIWVWPPLPQDELTSAPSGTTRATALVPQPTPAVTVRLLDAGLVDGHQSILYVETDTEADGEPERLMIFDVAGRDGRPLFDMSTRRPGLSGEESTQVSIAGASIGEQHIAVLFGFGDSRWIEWYDHLAQPTTSLFPVDLVPGLIVEVVLPSVGGRAVVTVETELWEPIRELYLIDNGAIAGFWTSSDADSSIGRLAYEGRWIVARQASEEAFSLIIVDLGRDTIEFPAVDAWIVFG